MNKTTTAPKVALITGGARRIGAAIAERLHHQGFDVFIHCRHSITEAQALADQLNRLRPHSAHVLLADLANLDHIATLTSRLQAQTSRLDLLVNNASSFYPTEIGNANEAQWDDLFSSNAKAPFFLSQALTEILTNSNGCIINIADIHGDRPLKKHTIYSMAKAANIMLTKSLALELAPHVRVNGIAPGAILWPEQEASLDHTEQQNILTKIPLGCSGAPENIAACVEFLSTDNNYITGQIINVDGGRALSN